MRFTVGWAPNAKRQLAEWWINRKDHRSAITAASDRIDKLLGGDPYRSVRPRGRYWELTIAPLSALCAIDIDDRMVKVLQIRWTTE